MRHEDHEEYEHEMKRKGSNAGALFTGFLLGGIAGIIAAFLMAPQSGDETRAQIREKSMELKGRAKDTVEETRMRAEQKIAETRALAGEKIQDISGRVEEVARTTRQQGEELTQQAQNTNNVENM
jgi:gas vesicle protein